MTDAPRCRRCGNTATASLLRVVDVASGSVTYCCRVVVSPSCFKTVRTADVERIEQLVAPSLGEGGSR